MKKNKMMRTASGLLAAALLTTGVISGTFAKYTTADTAEDLARIAKWGVDLAVSGSLYGKNYSAAGENTATTAAGGATVASSNTSKVVAPGTKSDDNGGLRIFLTGKPEVSAKVAATIESQNVYLKAGEYGVMREVSGITEENFTKDTYYKLDQSVYKLVSDWDAGATYYALEDHVEMTENGDYYPVCYTGLGTKGVNTENSIHEIAAELAKKLSASNTEVEPESSSAYSSTYQVDKVYGPNYNLIGLNINNTKVSWEWAFDNGKDAEDTILGDLSAGANVVMNTDAGYKKVTVANDLASVDGEADPVASLMTKFNVTLNVTQAD